MNLFYQRIFFILALIFLVSCEEDEELVGLEQTKESITGTWICTEESEYYKRIMTTYEVEIYEDTTQQSNYIYIKNFYGLGVDVEAEAKLVDYFIELEEQTIGNNFTVLNGTGVISDDYEEITWNYEVDDGSGQVDHVSAVYTKVIQ